jgi:hypothetical protein
MRARSVKLSGEASEAKGVTLPVPTLERANVDQNLMQYLRTKKKKIETELEPFIDGIRTMVKDSVGFTMFSKAYRDYASKYDHYSKIVQYFSKGLSKLTENPKDKMQWLLWYLGLLEGINHTTLNMLIMLLKANQDQIQITYPTNTPRIKHALSLDELEETFIPLTAKLNFLNENGLKETTSLIDTELRNAVAHFKFDIKNDDIYLEGKRAMPLITDGIFKLLTIFAGVHDCLGMLDIVKGVK